MEWTGTPPPALNYDVLLNIIAQSRSLRTGLALVSTCRVLNHEGARILLRNPITLSTEPGLRSFLYFLRRAPLSRPQHLRDLSLHMHDMQPKLARRLGRACPFMTGLESLSLDFPERILPSDPDLVTGLAKLGSLTRLSLRCSGTLVCTLLPLLRAPLKAVSLSWGYDDFPPWKIHWETVDEDDWPGYHPTILLENFADTLEELTYEYWYTSEDYRRPRKIFPRLQHLVIKQAHMFHVAPYVQAFPNLARISVHSYNDEDGFDEEFNEHVDDNHELNVARQLLPASVHGGTWEHLQEFEGSLRDFYMLGLVCHIPRLIVYAESSTASEYLPYLGETLSNTCPTYLQLFTTRSVKNYDSLGWLSTALLYFTFEYSGDNNSLAAAMEDFAFSMGQLQLGILSLTIATNSRLYSAGWDSDGWSALERSESDDEPDFVVPIVSRGREQEEGKTPRKHPPPLIAEEQMVEDFDVAAYTKGLVEACRTLRDVEVVVERPRNRGRRVAALARHGSREVECFEYDK